MGRVRFAGVHAVPHARIRKNEDYGGGWYGHWMRITEPKELDDELLKPLLHPHLVKD